MVTKINGKNIEITKGMQYYVEKKLRYFDKFLKEDTPVNISVSKRSNKFKIEAYLQYHRKDVKVKVEEDEFYAAVDKLMDILKNTISELHRKLKNKNKTSLRDQYKAEKAEDVDDMDEEDDSED